MIPYEISYERALYTECYLNNEKHIIKDFIDSDDFFFICFYYDTSEFETYYKKPYIVDCMKSWTDKMDGKVLYIQVNTHVSVWTDIMISQNRKNYPTDSLRLLYCAMLKRCVYLDTDVYMNVPLNLSGFPKTFIVDNCSGTVTYSVGGKDPLKKWFNWYETEALKISKKMQPIGDVEAYGKTRFVENIRLNLDHFSKLYCFKRDNKPICFKNKTNDLDIVSSRSFSKECFPILQKYLDEKGYLVEEDCENVVILY